MRRFRIMKRHAEVVGAGIGGLTVAAALAQRGWTVTVHERAPDLRAFGAGIYLWANGLAVLQAVGAYDEAISGAHIGPVFETRDHRNDTMETIPINHTGANRLVTILRETLIRSLRHACDRPGVQILTGSEVVSASEDGRIELANGKHRTADLVVASDGVNSLVRDALDLLYWRKSLGYGAIRMLIPRSDGDVPEVDRARYIEYFSGTRRILYTPASTSDLYVALCCKEDDLSARRVPIDPAEWCASFPHLEPLVTRLGSAGRWDTFEILKLRRWSRGRVAIIGDAAHAMPPYLGQGGGCALMNALSLAVFADRHQSDLTRGLARWEETERPLTEHTQDTANSLGDMNLWPDELRSDVLKITGRSPYLAGLRMRTAMHVPTGTAAASERPTTIGAPVTFNHDKELT